MTTSTEKRLLIFAGEHKRYKYIANQLLDSFPNAALVIQGNPQSARQKHADFDCSFSAESIELLRRHLEERDRVESAYYKDDSFRSSDHTKSIDVTVETLNSSEVIEFVASINPNVVFTFGIGILRKNILKSLCNAKIVNLHFALLPHYRGADTLLWPLYFQQPGHIGFTLHEVDEKIDNGPIYHQEKTCFSKGDSIHDIFCKTIIQANRSTQKLVSLLMQGENLTPIIPKSEGKLFFRNEFTPHHLKIIYQFLEEEMFTKYLEGKWPCRKLKSKSCMEQYFEIPRSTSD